MKKPLLTALAVALAAFAGTASAQEFQPIGYAHSVSFGAAYGYGSDPLANFAGGILDINLPGARLPGYSYFRTRVEFDGDGITAGFAASLGAGFHYMQHIAAGLYVYPFVQVKGELHNAAWPTKADFSPGAGAGLEYQFSSNIGAFVQGAYNYAVVEGISRPAAKVGLVFAFGKANSIEARKQKPAGAVNPDAAQARTASQAARPSAVSVPFMEGEYNVGNTSRTKILGLVPYLLSNPGATVEIMAYGDKLTGKTDAGLASRREQAVRDILTGAGIDTDRITTGQPTAALSITTQPGSVAIVKIK